MAKHRQEKLNLKLELKEKEERVRWVTEVLRHLAIDYSLDDAGRLKDPALLTPRVCRYVRLKRSLI